MVRGFDPLITEILAPILKCDELKGLYLRIIFGRNTSGTTLDPQSLTFELFLCSPLYQRLPYLTGCAPGARVVYYVSLTTHTTHRIRHPAEIRHTVGVSPTNLFSLTHPIGPINICTSVRQLISISH